MDSNMSCDDLSLANTKLFRSNTLVYWVSKFLANCFMVFFSLPSVIVDAPSFRSTLLKQVEGQHKP